MERAEAVEAGATLKNFFQFFPQTPKFDIYIFIYIFSFCAVKNQKNISIKYIVRELAIEYA